MMIKDIWQFSSLTREICFLENEEATFDWNVEQMLGVLISTLNDSNYKNLILALADKWVEMRRNNRNPGSITMADLEFAYGRKPFRGNDDDIRKISEDYDKERKNSLDNNHDLFNGSEISSWEDDTVFDVKGFNSTLIGSDRAVDVPSSLRPSAANPIKGLSKRISSLLKPKSKLKRCTGIINYGIDREMVKDGSQFVDYCPLNLKADYPLKAIREFTNGHSTLLVTLINQDADQKNVFFLLKDLLLMPLEKETQMEYINNILDYALNSGKGEAVSCVQGDLVDMAFVNKKWNFIQAAARTRWISSIFRYIPYKDEEKMLNIMGCDLEDLPLVEMTEVNMAQGTIPVEAGLEIRRSFRVRRNDRFILDRLNARVNKSKTNGKGKLYLKIFLNNPALSHGSKVLESLSKIK